MTWCHLYNHPSYSFIFLLYIYIASMMYCYLAMKALKRIRVAEFLLSGYLRRLKHDAKIIVQSNVITVTFRVFFLFYYLSPLLLTKEQFQDTKILSYWIGMIFYVQLLLIPVIFSCKRNICHAVRTRQNKVHSCIDECSHSIIEMIAPPRFSTSHML